MLPCHRLRQGKKEVERERSREGREENNEREREREGRHLTTNNFPFPPIARFAKNFTSFVVEEFNF